MTKDRDLTETIDCEAFRTAVQERLDGDLGPDAARVLDGHLRGCESCREFDAGLREVRNALRSLHTPEFPEDALDRVWARTIESEPRPRWWVRPVRWRGAVAAAAAVIVLGVAIWIAVRDSGPSPRDEEIARAARDARYVLELTAQAMRTGEKAAVEGVLEGRVSPALKRMVVRWPGGPEDPPRRDGA